MTEMTAVNVALDIFSIVLSMIPISYLIAERRYKQRTNQYFFGIVISNIFMIFGDLADWLIPSPHEAAEKVVLNILTVVFYTASAFILFFFSRYVAENLSFTGRIRKLYIASVNFACTAQIVAALVSPFTGLVFYVTDEGYNRGPLFFVSQIVPLYCYILFTVLIVAYRKNLSKRQTFFFIMYIALTSAGLFTQALLQGIAIVNSFVTLALLMILVSIQLEHEDIVKNQEKKIADQYVDIMLSQIQPHFLYNSLGTIYSLCEINPSEAKKAIKEFSDFLRGNMKSLKAREPIPFKEELSHTMNYLYLEQRRFREKLTVICNIKNDDFYIPPLTLQPLVENAVKHGILNNFEGGGVLVISAEEEAEQAVITISDDGVGIEKAKEYSTLRKHNHVGLENVSSRLKNMVGGSLDIESGDWGTKVTLRIPLTEE